MSAVDNPASPFEFSHIQVISCVELNPRFCTENLHHTPAFWFNNCTHKIIRSQIFIYNEIVVISNLAVMNFKNPERAMQIQYFHPGHTIGEIKENTGFDLRVAPDAAETPTPTQNILELIEEIDRDGVRLSEFR